MEISGLLERLPADFIAHTVFADHASEVYGVSLLTMTTKQVRDDVLYFGDNTLIPANLPADTLFNCVLAGGDPLPESLIKRGACNIIVLSDEADPLECFNILQATFLENRELITIMQRMLAAHFSNRGLQYLVEEAAIALGHPIVVIDSNHRYIAYHLGDLEGSNSHLARQMTMELEEGTLGDEVISYINEHEIDSEIARNAGILDTYNHMLGARTMTTAAMINGICVAHVMMIESKSPLTELDRECLLRLEKFVAQELQKLTVYGHSSGERGSFFLASLLVDDHPSEAVTQRRLRELNFHPKQEFYVVVMQVGGEGLDQLDVEMVAGQLRAALHHSLYTRHRRKFVALISRDRGEGIDDNSLRLIENVALLNGLKVGISNAYYRLSDTHSSYREARQAVRYGSARRSGLTEETVFWYRDYTPQHLIDLAARRADLQGFVHPSLQAIREYDDAHGTELTETLYQYLQCAGSVQRAAKLLSLHKNTMLYRLARIRKLLEPSTSLESGEDRFLLQMSFRVLLFNGYFVPRVVVGRNDLRA